MGLAKSAARKLRFLPAPDAAPGPAGRTPVGRSPENFREVPPAEQGPRKYRDRISGAPVLERSRLEGNAGTAHSWRFNDFVSSFLLMLPYRIDNVERALTAGDWQSASLAAQSLSWSASMAGACRLELVAALIDADLQAGHSARARETGCILRPAAAELTAALAPLLAAAH
ncbi:hypothetical protein [Arthrobacter sp. 92]|jgi:hypothetical protein|uniref:hypothetical protein n=1 Tax=Arthrobacter sp. 92 TaxID=3418175 RepID=UPI003D077F0C